MEYKKYFMTVGKLSSSPAPFLSSKLYWSTATSFVYPSLMAAFVHQWQAELSGHNRGGRAHKTYNILPSAPFREKFSNLWFTEARTTQMSRRCWFSILIQICHELVATRPFKHCITVENHVFVIFLSDNAALRLCYLLN